MNKNRLIKAISFSLCLLSFALVLITNAGFLEVSEDLVIMGNGTLERELGAQSAPFFTGQKLSESIVPIYLVHENATSFYRSDFELILSNNSTIYYQSASALGGAKHYLSNKNYKLGVCTGFQYIGVQNKTFSFESSPDLSEALIKSEVEGRSVVRARVVNRSHYHQRTVDTLTWLEGNYILDWKFLVLGIEYPEAFEDDYLGCP